MSFWDQLFGKEGQMSKESTMTGGQNNLLDQLLGGLSGGNAGGGSLGSGMGWLQQLLGGDTEAFEAPLMRNYEENLIPGLAERFSGIGAGSQNSSAFSQGLSSAAGGLTEQLGAMRGGLQQQGLSQLMQMLGLGLGSNSFENVYKPSQPGFLQGIAGGIGSGIGSGMGSYFSNKFGGK